MLRKDLVALYFREFEILMLLQCQKKHENMNIQKVQQTLLLFVISD